MKVGRLNQLVFSYLPRVEKVEADNVAVVKENRNINYKTEMGQFEICGLYGYILFITINNISH